ncbi:hypothetical protein NX059_002950 [Plenodomus lindquistii]|nr:hypothetical protein NX059_002950 [Plenodomus lindquistii]
MRYLNKDLAFLFTSTDPDDWNSWYTYLRWVGLYMPGADHKINAWNSELVELWMSDPYRNLGVQKQQTDQFEYVNLGDLSPEQFSRRFQIALNTFWDSTMGLLYRMGDLTSRDLEQQNDTDARVWTPTNAIGERYDGVQYKCNTIFAALSIVISWLLFVAASVSVFLRFMTRAPDILGYVSTLARDDPYFDKYVPSHLDGLEAARSLRGVRVIVGDVHKEAKVGHIAFASMDAGPVRVSEKRVYD